MADEQDQENKTEEPTSKRLEEAREEGQLPISREVSSWFMFAGIIIAVGMILPMVAAKLTKILTVFLEAPHQFSMEDRGLQLLLGNVILEVSLASFIIFLMLMILAGLGVISQVGFFASTKLLEPKWDRISPTAGFKRLFSANALVELGKSLVKLVIVGGICYSILIPSFQNIDWAIGLSMLRVAAHVQSMSLHLLLVIMVVVTLVAAVDLVYQRYTYHKNMMMTKQEVKDEHKQSEGDPMIKSRLRSIRLEKARKRMMAQVPKADVVITNPTHYAVALQYQAGKMNAPVVLAKGLDVIAQKIREIAEKNDVPLVANPPLARALYASAEVDQEIPAEHYRAVAEVISYVYKLKKKTV